jgi:hypothetical protein
MREMIVYCLVLEGITLVVSACTAVAGDVGS